MTTTTTTENFFDGVGLGGSPSSKLSDVDDYVDGTILSQRVMDHIPFGEKDPDHNNDGSVRQKLVVTVQTNLRNWQGVTKIPLIDKDDPSKGQKPGDQDDGKRSIHLPEYSNIQGAVAQAVREKNDGKNGPLADGSRLAVKVINLKDVGKGNPLKEHAALYEPVAASAGFFEASQPAAAPAQQPAAEPVQQAAAPAPEPRSDPWANAASAQQGANPQPAQNKPPF